MDGSTEPIIAIIGHPIAGNPSQFAAERALREMKLEWRVLSFDVKPDDVAAALDGFSVIGIAGVLIDPSLMAEASQWYGQRYADDQGNGSEPTIDCLHRQGDRWIGSYQRKAWVDDLIAEQAGDQRILLGEFDDSVPVSREIFGDQVISLPPEPELIASADLIVVSPLGEATETLEAKEWPACDPSKLVVDLSDGHPEQADWRQRGYQVSGRLEQQVGTLQRCLETWTGKTPSSNVIHDAIEEYFGV